MKTIYIIFAAVLILISCKPETEELFEKTADERAAEAIQKLTNDLVEPTNGWRVKYQPEDESGSFWVLLHFNEDKTLVIESDLGQRDGEFFMDTLTYRVDNSLGLELIFETYSFFSYLFERDQASFLAEYEFIYVNKTPDGELVFRSKTDPANPTILVFEPANANDKALLGQEVSENINTIAEDIGGLLFTSPGYQLTYVDKDLRIYLDVDATRRTLSINTVAKKSTESGAQAVTFVSGYYIQGDSLIFHEPFEGTFQGVNLSIKSILFSKLVEGQLDICGGQIVHNYEGVTSQDDDVLLEATLSSPSGATFANYEFLVGPLEYIFANGEPMATQIENDITGAGAMQLYYDFDGFYALGFFISNADGTTTFYLKEFTPELVGNNLVFNFADEISVFGNPDSPANIDNVDQYLEALTAGGQTYVFHIQDEIYEVHNPCTGWSAAFFGIQ